MKTTFFPYVAKDLQGNTIFQSNMDVDNIIELRRNEKYDIQGKKMIFYVNRGDEDMTFTFDMKDIKEARKIYNDQKMEQHLTQKENK